jgi:hypothetical protein
MVHHFFHLLEGLGIAILVTGLLLGWVLHVGYARLRGTHISRKDRKAIQS